MLVLPRAILPPLRYDASMALPSLLSRLVSSGGARFSALGLASLHSDADADADLAQTRSLRAHEPLLDANRPLWSNANSRLSLIDRSWRTATINHKSHTRRYHGAASGPQRGDVDLDPGPIRLFGGGQRSERAGRLEPGTWNCGERWQYGSDVRLLGFARPRSFDLYGKPSNIHAHLHIHICVRTNLDLDLDLNLGGCDPFAAIG